MLVIGETTAFPLIRAPVVGDVSTQSEVIRRDKAEQ